MKFDNREDNQALNNSEVFQSFMKDYLDGQVEDDEAESKVEQILKELEEEELDEDLEEEGEVEEEDLEMFASLCAGLRKFSESLEDERNYKASFAVDQTIRKVKQILEGDE